MAAAELTFFWIALSLYSLSFAAMAFGQVLKRPSWSSRAWQAVLAGSTAHALALVLRGAAAQAPPFVTYAESISFTVFLLVGAFLLVSRNDPNRNVLWIFLGPICLLLMGSAALESAPYMRLAPSLQSWWLVVHILFALLAVGSLGVAFAMAVLLVKPLAHTWMPKPEEADLFFFRSLSLAFIFQAVMVAAGAIWANKAWGRFWGWDPIETTSLLTLFIYGIAIHLRLSYGWKGKKMAALVIAAFLLTIYGIWGVPVLMQSIHLYQAP